MLKRFSKRRALAVAAIVLFFGAPVAAGTIFAIAEYGVRLIPQAAVPPNCTNPDRTCVWTKSADNLLYYHKTDGTDNAIALGGGTLQGAYTAGGAGGGTLTVTSSGGGLIIRDAATPIGTSLIAAQNNAGSTTFLSVLAASAGGAVASFADGASAAVCSANQGCLAYNNAKQAFVASYSGGAFIPITIKTWDQQIWATNNSATSSNAGNLTIGLLTRFPSASTAVGIKGYWAGAAETVKCNLWNTAGTRLASGTVAVSGAGTYTCNFSSTFSMVASTSYWFAVYGTTTSTYTSVSDSNFPALPVILDNAFGAPMMIPVNGSAYATGDVVPVTVITTQWAPAQPNFTTP